VQRELQLTRPRVDSGLCVLAACLDSTLRLLDKKGGDLLASYQGHTHEGVKMDAALLPSDAYVVGSSEDGACQTLFFSGPSPGNDTPF
jgi:hypothetical protein